MFLRGGRAGAASAWDCALRDACLTFSLCGGHSGSTALVTHVGHVARWFRARALKFPGPACNLVAVPIGSVICSSCPASLSLTEPQFPLPQEEDGDPSVALSALVQGQKGRFMSVGPWPLLGALCRWHLSLFMSSEDTWAMQTGLLSPQSLECGGCPGSGCEGGRTRGCQEEERKHKSTEACACVMGGEGVWFWGARL